MAFARSITSLRKATFLRFSRDAGFYGSPSMLSREISHSIEARSKARFLRLNYGYQPAQNIRLFSSSSFEDHSNLSEKQKNELMFEEFGKRLNSDTDLVDLLVENLSHDVKLQLADQILSSRINGKAYTSFISGRHRRAIAVREVSMSLGLQTAKPEADKDGDGHVSSEELDEWLHTVAKVKAGENKASIGVDPASDEIRLTQLQIRRLLLISGIPFVAFGILDNGIMIIAGDLIDQHFGVFLGISTMAAAGLGNLFSDVIGLVFGDWVERGARKMGLKDPQLTVKQMKMRQTKGVQLVASTIGITIGCLIGMFPLLFM